MRLKRFNKLFIILLFCIICFSCAKPVSLKKPEKVKPFAYKGLIWWRIDLFRGKKNRLVVGFANFVVTDHSLYVKLKTPIGSSLGLFKWDEKLPYTIKLYDFYHKRVYIIKVSKKLKTYEIPYYFLGLKKSKAEADLSRFKVKYIFYNSNKKGIVSSPYFRIFWVIKRLEPLKEKIPELNIPEEKFERILINFD